MAKDTSVIDQIKQEEEKADKDLESAKHNIEKELGAMRSEHEQKLLKIDDTIDSEKAKILQQAKDKIGAKKREFDEKQEQAMQELDKITEENINKIASTVTQGIISEEN